MTIFKLLKLAVDALKEGFYMFKLDEWKFLGELLS